MRDRHHSGEPMASARPARWWRRLAAVARERRGNVIIEFALCAAAFMGLLIASLQVAIVYFAQQGIQTSAEIMARRVMTGSVTQATKTKAQFLADACTTLPPYMKCANLVADVRTADSFSNLDMSMPTLTYDSNGNVVGGTTYNTGVSGGIVILRLMYRWPVSPGPLGFNLSNTGSAGQRLLVGTMVFKSEPYA